MGTSIALDLVVTLAVAVSGIGLSVALAALIFSGSLTEGLPRASSGFVVGGGIATTILGLRSAFVPVAAVSQDGPVVVIVAVVASLTQSAGGTDASEVLVLVGGVSFVSAVLLLALGSVGVGQAVRFFPTTVVSGFVAGTGWLLLKGGMDVMSSRALGLGDLGGLVAWDQLRQWLPGMLLGLGVYALSGARKVPVLAPSGLIVATVVGFYLIVVTASSVAAAEAGGWLIGPFASATILDPIGPSDLTDASWGQLADQLGGIASALLVVVIALLLNVTGLEAVTAKRVDVDREVRWVGVANLLASPLGSPPAFHALGDTVLASRLGATGRRVPLLAGLLTIGVGLAGAQFVGLVPRFVAGGLLIAVGLQLLASWLGEVRRATNQLDASLSLIILLTIAFVGILEGIFFGLVLAYALFVMRYSRVDPIRRLVTGAHARSRVDRTFGEADALDRVADAILVVEMQGYLFFGSATAIAERVERAGASGTEPVRHVLFDFGRVTGVDSAAAAMLDDLIVTLVDRAVHVAVAAPPPELTSLSLRRSGRAETGASTLSGVVLPKAASGEAHVGSAVGVDDVSSHPDIEDALAHAEEALLAEHAPDPASNPAVDLAPEIFDRFERRHARAGSVLIEQGDPSEAMMYLLSGEATAWTNQHDGSRHRIRRFHGPCWVGEMGFLRSQPRSAEVVAETDLELIWIDRISFSELERDEPSVALRLYEHMAAGLADRASSLSIALARALD